MSPIYSSLQVILTDNTITRASEFLCEDRCKVADASASIIPCLLGALLAKGSTTPIQIALSKAGRNYNNLQDNIVSIFSGNADERISYSGFRLLDAIFGDKLGEFTTLISSTFGMSYSNTDQLLLMITPIIASDLGYRATEYKWGMTGLLGRLNYEKSSYLHLIPVGFASLFGLGSNDELGNFVPVIESTEADYKLKEPTPPWLVWAIIVAGGVIIAFWWKSCEDSTSTKVKDTVTTATSAMVEGTISTVSKALEKVSTIVILPDGKRLQAYKGGIEDQLVRFLSSDEYGNASTDQLKDKWFNFDNIEFKYGSSTELTDISKPQLHNIAVILNNYKDTKVIIAGFTDRTGTIESNLKLSQDRANTIRNYLIEEGIEGSRISAIGYGDQYATHAADAPDIDRALDRRIALRFEK